MIRDARERPAEVGGVVVVSEVGGVVVGRAEAAEEIAEALDLPREWRSEESVVEAVERLVDMCFVSPAASPACPPAALSWREELSEELDPLQEEWSSVLERSGVLDALPAAW